jgi:hypothetical protein
LKRLRCKKKEEEKFLRHEKQIHMIGVDNTYKTKRYGEEIDISKDNTNIGL